MGIFSDLKEFIFGRKKRKDDEIRLALERINPVKFYQTLADYGVSLGLSVDGAVVDRGFTNSTEVNYALNGIIFRLDGAVAACGINSTMSDGFTPAIYFVSGTVGRSGGFTGPFTITTLKMCKEDLEKAVIKLKKFKEQKKLESINEDFV